MSNSTRISYRTHCFIWEVISHPYPTINGRLVNTLRSRQDVRHFADDIFTCIVFNENCCILINCHRNMFARVQLTIIEHWFRFWGGAIRRQTIIWTNDDGLAPSGDKPLSEPMMVSLPTHIGVARPQWVNVVVTVLHWCNSLTLH